MKDIEELVNAWADAEQHGDVDGLDRLLADDFAGIGPVGFVLPKQAWLSRFDQGLRYESLAVEDVAVRQYGDAAVVVAEQHARGSHQGNPTPADTRLSIVATRHGGDAWRIAGIQYSFLGPPAGTPP
jgi:ketosteroid isomerase-like protein